MTLPEGLSYVPGFLTEAEERDVLAARPRGGWCEASASP